MTEPTRKTVTATAGTLIDRMHEGVRLSEQKRAAAAQRRARVSAQVERDLHARYPNASETRARLSAEWQAEKDKLYAAHVNGEQWGYRLTVMYGVAQLATEVTALTQRVDVLAVQQIRTNELLERIGDLLERGLGIRD